MAHLSHKEAQKRIEELDKFLVHHVDEEDNLVKAQTNLVDLTLEIIDSNRSQTRKMKEIVDCLNLLKRYVEKQTSIKDQILQASMQKQVIDKKMKGGHFDKKTEDETAVVQGSAVPAETPTTGGNIVKEDKQEVVTDDAN